MGETLWLSETVVVQFERCKSIHFGRALQPVCRVVDQLEQCKGSSPWGPREGGIVFIAMNPVFIGNYHNHAKTQGFLFDLSRSQTGEALEPSQYFPPSMRTECVQKREDGL
jgi:hypothetical protein